MLKKILSIGFPLGILTVLYGWATSGGIFDWVYEANPNYIWKTASEMSVPLIWVLNIIMVCVFVYIYAKVEKGLVQKCRVQKGVQFGLILWVAMYMTGAMDDYLYSITAHQVIAYHLVWGLVLALLQGIFISAFYDRGLPFSCCSGACSTSPKSEKLQPKKTTQKKVIKKKTASAKKK
ncbi:MAG: hypothetical protein JXR30_00070 [Alphaproteobacteria bacterium]|nr:hypothetical protein [Alphaproteobacteria bacterium]